MTYVPYENDMKVILLVLINILMCTLTTDWRNKYTSVFKPFLAGYVWLVGGVGVGMGSVPSSGSLLSGEVGGGALPSGSRYFQGVITFRIY